MLRSLWLLSAVALGGAAATPGLAQDLDAGLAKSVQCAACHGSDGVAPNPTFPSLAGQNAGYLELQLKRFRTGERYDPVMSPIAESLGDRDIDDLAAYYSRIGPLAEQPNIR